MSGEHPALSIRRDLFPECSARGENTSSLVFQYSMKQSFKYMSPLSHRILFVFDSFYAFIISLIDRFTGWTNCLFVVKRRTIHFRKNCLPCQERSEGCLPVKNRLVSYWKRFTADALTIQKVCVLFYDTWQIYIRWESD